LENEKVAKAGDTMTGDLIMDGTAGETDIVLKGDPIDTTAPVNGSALLLRDGADVSIGGVAAITTNPADPGNVAFFVGSLDKATGVIVDGAAAVIAPTNIAVGTPGAVLGSRMVCSGFTSAGLPILAWEDPPPAAYSPACANATDFLIHIGAGTSAWAEVCVITTTQQIEASQTLTVFWSMYLDNRSARTGNFEVTFTTNGAAPGSPVGAPVIVSAGMNENVSGSAAYPSGVVYPVGTTFEYHIRATGDHALFELWAMGTINPAEMEIQVR
jgi:hypothetical protein